MLDAIPSIIEAVAPSNFPSKCVLCVHDKAARALFSILVKNHGLASFMGGARFVGFKGRHTGHYLE